MGEIAKMASNTRFKGGFCLLMVLLVFGGSRTAWATPINVDRLTEAIGKAENSKRYPYGVKSIDTGGNVAYARKICRQSVVNNIKRWEKAGKPGEFIAFMGARYAPTKGATDDPQGLNNHWVKNVTHFYERGQRV